MVRSWCALPLTLAICLFVGCGEESLPAPEVAKVGGTVNLDGKPMQGGVVRFSVPGQAPRDIPVANGTFDGEGYVGLNVIHVLWEEEGAANPMDPSSRLTVNKVDPKFSGPNSPFQEAIGAEGKTDLKFDVTSAKK
jgi:hypothetical protein